MLQSGEYSICFRREENMCEIDYSVTTAGSFNLGTTVANADMKAISSDVSPFCTLWGSVRNLMSQKSSYLNVKIPVG